MEKGTYYIRLAEAIKSELIIFGEHLDLDLSRTYDLTFTTDDPGNTELALGYIPLNNNLDFFSKSKECQVSFELSIKKCLEDYFDNSSDFSEEVFVSSQNNEILILINANQ